jgi:hypothetical protein
MGSIISAFGKISPIQKSKTKMEKMPNIHRH